MFTKWLILVNSLKNKMDEYECQDKEECENIKDIYNQIIDVEIDIKNLKQGE